MHIQWNMFAYANAGCGLPSTQTGGMAQLAPGGDTDSDADGSSGAADASGATADNPIMQALAQALESLGLTLTAAPAAAADSGAAATPASDATASGAATATAAAGSASSAGAPAASAPVDLNEAHTIARDIRHVMRALFMDVQAENLLAPAGTGSSGASPQSSFGSGLAALISQVQGGSVPANLQNAFGNLVSDLEKIGGASGASGAPVSAGDTSPASAAAPNAAATSSPESTTPATAGGASYQGLLLQFLTNLQSDLGLGYGGSSAAPAQAASSGLMVNTLA